MTTEQKDGTSATGAVKRMARPPGEKKKTQKKPQVEREEKERQQNRAEGKSKGRTTADQHPNKHISLRQKK